MLRSILAVVAGYATLFVLATAATVALAFIVPELAAETPEASPPAWYIAFNLAYSALFAVVAGYVTATLARREELRHAAALAALILLLGVPYIFIMRGGIQPLWYLVALPLFGAAGAVAGGALKARLDVRAAHPGGTR